MDRSLLTARVLTSLIFVAAASGAHALTLHVNCGKETGLTTIGAAIKVVQSFEESRAVTVLVTGQCHENVVIQGIDRLTLTAVNGASISDASGGKLDVISILDSRSISVNGFTINAGADGVSGSNGVTCLEFSVCRIAGNVIQGAADGGGFLVGQSSLATLDGDTLQNNGIGLLVTSRSSARLGGQFRNFIARGNGRGIQMNRTAFVYVGAVVENSTDVGAAVIGNSSLVITGSISGSGSAGVLVRESSFARFDSASISGNAGGGVFLKDLSMGDFINGSTVTGNVGTDVFCSPQFAATRGTGSIGGGTTNCIEP
jgi:hypothetical protein